MHKYYTGFRACFVICAAVLPNCLQAQWTACGTGPVQCAPTGNVGIGLTNPITPLQVTADITGPADGWGNSQILASGTSNSNQRLAIGFATVQNVGFIQPYVNGTGYNNLLLNPAGGNVGIGTIAPNYKLDVGPGTSGTETATSGSQGLIRNNSFADLSPYTQARIIVYGGAGVDLTNWGYLGYGSDANMRIIYGHTGQNHQLQIGQSSAMDGTGAFTPSMTVDGTSGNVGIGTTYPAAKLDVGGNLKVEGAITFPDGSMQRTAASSGQYSICVSNASQNQAVCPSGCSPTQVSSGASCQTNVKSNSCTANSGFTPQGFATYGVCCVCH